MAISSVGKRVLQTPLVGYAASIPCINSQEASSVCVRAVCSGPSLSLAFSRAALRMHGVDMHQWRESTPIRIPLVAPLVVLLGCAAPQSGHLYSNSAQEQGDARVGQYISSQWSFETSSFWLEGPGTSRVGTPGRSCSRTAIEAVAAERQQGLIHREALARLTEKVSQRYPQYRYPMFLPMLLDAELIRQAAEAAPPP